MSHKTYIVVEVRLWTHLWRSKTTMKILEK